MASMVISISHLVSTKNTGSSGTKIAPMMFFYMRKVAVSITNWCANEYKRIYSAIIICISTSSTLTLDQ